jgi:hypothetical protein
MTLVAEVASKHATGNHIAGIVVIEITKFFSGGICTANQPDKSGI